MDRVLDALGQPLDRGDTAVLWARTGTSTFPVICIIERFTKASVFVRYIWAAKGYEGFLNTRKRVMREYSGECRKLARIRGLEQAMRELTN